MALQATVQRRATQVRDGFPELGKDKKPVTPLLLVKRYLRAGDNKLRFVVNRKPASVAVDPYHLSIDRQLDDNTKDL